MRFTLAQLRKFKMPYSFDEELDLSNELNGFEDILSSSVCKVHTVIKERGEETYLCEFNVQIDLVLEDSVTLDEIPFNINVNSEELFTTSTEIEDATLIEGITLDTKEAIIETILENKPMSSTNHEFISDIDDDEEDDDVNPQFASLKDLL